ncbi:MAG: hypothetical protein ISS34_04275 [Candidatus Omnitrophica bacterium]|nr:hypothetical protein [Candidatus Omnitrophota bacterium]
MNSRIKLKIADIITKMQSDFALAQLSEEEKKLEVTERFDNFFYNQERKEEISINVEIVDRLPQIKKTKLSFVTYHPEDGSENWRLLQKGDTYIYKSPLEDKRQLMLVNKTFDKVTAYLLPKKDKGRVWGSTDIIYDFLQVLMINYLAQRSAGIFTHSIGVKDIDGKGLLFAGKSGAGKTTTAKLWHNQSRAMVLNDDRIIVRKRNGGFFIHGCPWHGEFSDYLNSRIEAAPLKKIFFIHHAPKNTARRISVKTAFKLLYPALFPPFWDKGCLENVVSFSQDLIENVPCYSLGFVNDKKMIEFVRKIETNL